MKTTAVSDPLEFFKMKIGRPGAEQPLKLTASPWKVVYDSMNTANYRTRLAYLLQLLVAVFVYICRNLTLFIEILGAISSELSQSLNSSESIYSSLFMV